MGNQNIISGIKLFFIKNIIIQHYNDYDIIIKLFIHISIIYISNYNKITL